MAAELHFAFVLAAASRGSAVARDVVRRMRPSVKVPFRRRFRCSIACPSAAHFIAVLPFAVNQWESLYPWH